MEKVIQARDLREGMTLAFANERYNYIIEDVQYTRDEKVKVISGNDTRVEYFDAGAWVYVIV
jgi:hypothetical protein